MIRLAQRTRWSAVTTAVLLVRPRSPTRREWHLQGKDLGEPDDLVRGFPRPVKSSVHDRRQVPERQIWLIRKRVGFLKIIDQSSKFGEHL